MKKMWNSSVTWFKSLSRGWQAALVVAFIAMMAVSAATDDTTTEAAKPKHTGPKVVDVRGLTLPTARKQLKLHGNYTADAKSKGAIFGVLVEENFTVCKQHKPKGHLVPLEVAKRDC